MTGTLVGATFVQPNLVEYQGKKSLVFVFAVRPDLTFHFRRLCDLCDAVLILNGGVCVWGHLDLL